MMTLRELLRGSPCSFSREDGEDVELLDQYGQGVEISERSGILVNHRERILVRWSDHFQAGLSATLEFHTSPLVFTYALYRARYNINPDYRDEVDHLLEEADDAEAPLSFSFPDGAARPALLERAFLAGIEHLALELCSDWQASDVFLFAACGAFHAYEHWCAGESGDVEFYLQRLDHEVSDRDFIHGIIGVFEGALKWLEGQPRQQNGP